VTAGRPMLSDMLLAQGYLFDQTHNVWSRSAIEEATFAYSDGDEVEQRIAGAVASSTDVSLFSSELEAHQIDWPSIYHLSADRANLLRPVSSAFSGARILEIGAGCGAITRFLGECGGHVIGLEGSARRAAIAASRCRDLPDVCVLNERFDAFETNEKFEIVTLIGVLEYSRLFNAGDDPVHEMLRHALDLLADDGILIVAIENQLGLKYFAGMPEDHLGRAMAGIDDVYDANSVVTFGKVELTARLAKAGFARSEFALPFPDYKLPQNVVLPAALAPSVEFNAASLAGQASLSDHQMRYPPLFSLGRAFDVVGRNDLLADLSNSFLVLAGKSSTSCRFADLAPGVLAEQYSIHRQPAFKKLARFVTTEGGVCVRRSRLCPEAVASSALLEIHLRDEKYFHGIRWSERFEKIVTRPGWRIEEVGAWLDVWVNALARALPGQPPSEQIQLDTPIPAELFDAVPGNLMVDEHGDASFFDLEWHFKAPLTFGYLIFRAMKLTLGAMISTATPAEPRLLQTAIFIEALLRLRGLILTPTHVQTYLGMESALIAEVQADLGKPLKLADYQSEIIGTSPNVSELLLGEHASLHKAMAENADMRVTLDQLGDRLNLSEAELASERHQAALLGQFIADLNGGSSESQFDVYRSAVDLVGSVQIQLSQQGAEIGELKQQLDIQTNENDELKENLATQLRVNEAMAEEQGRAEHANGSLESELQLMKASKSWVITAPLRHGNLQWRKIRSGVRRRLGVAAKSAYQSLPMAPARKRAIKGVLLRTFAPILSHTAAYQRWRAYEATHAATPIEGRSISAPYPSFTQPVHDIAENILWQADGIREWTDYADVKQRIATELGVQRDTRRPASLSLINFAKLSPEDAAKKIALPPVVDAPQVTILVPVYNQLVTTLECLASIAASQQPGDPTFEVLIANDASTDDTASVLATIANLRVVNQPENLGFLRNCNAASVQARGQYLVFLNNDVQVTPGWLAAMLRSMADDEQVGAVGPKIVYPSGWLQEAGTRLHRDGSAELTGLNDQPDLARYTYSRNVDYCSGACLLVRTGEFRELGGFDTIYAPAYCEDSDLCMRLRAKGRRIVYCAEATVIHHLSKTSDALPSDYKLSCIAKNLDTFASRWRTDLDNLDSVRTIAFYLPQFHPIAENDLWWGQGFTEWTNVTKAQPNFVGHYQPRLPADLGYYDLRLPEILQKQAELARRYGIGGFCYYYYWFAGHRLLERPIEQMLATGKPDFPFCLCWANENWTRRWDGQEHEILMGQQHSDDDDLAVIHDLIRYFRSSNYIRIDGKPLILVYRITLFPDFARTAALWREVCRKEGIGEIYIAQVESFELVSSGIHPSQMGCDAAVEFPPQGMARPIQIDSPLLNKEFGGAVADYRDIAVTYATRELAPYKRFMGVMAGWDNTARRQNNSYCFQNATPGAFQAWMEATIQRTKQQSSGDERLVFINAWNEWAEGTYLEPDRRFGHSFLQAHANAMDADYLMRANKYSLG
jgi:GT2 family glycosyltransferase